MWQGGGGDAGGQRLSCRDWTKKLQKKKMAIFFFFAIKKSRSTGVTEEYGLYTS